MTTTVETKPTAPVDLTAHQGHHPLPPQHSLGRQLLAAVPDALHRLDPRQLVHNPVMFVVEVVSVVSMVLAIVNPSVFAITVVVWLWLTVIFANLADAVAEGRGKAQAATLRAARTDTLAHKLTGGQQFEVSSAELRPGDLVVVSAGEVIPGDGDVVEGVASVDESAITGESAPVIREAGGDRSAVTGGTTVLSDRIIIKITTEPGKTFLDKMIALVEGANRQRTPNEIALTILLSSLSIIFMLVVLTIEPLARYSGTSVQVIVLVCLLVCLIPTTIGALLSAIGIAGMDRLVQRNVLAVSGRAVEAAGDVNTLLLDKTGTITLGNRQASALHRVDGVSLDHLARAAHLGSGADGTPEGRSIITLVENDHPEAADHARQLAGQGTVTQVEFSASTRMSGIDLADGSQVRKGAPSAVAEWVTALGGTVPAQVDELVRQAAEQGCTPLVVAEHSADGRARALGVIPLKDIVKPGMRARFDALRTMGIRTVMVTGDNPVTAKVIAEEAGVDDYIAEATPETKLSYIREAQSGGAMVAMCGDGTNDAPALAQADVGVAMNTGTSAAKEAGNMVDLDSDPTKVIEIVGIGKQLLMTRGALTTFSVANDIAKYFAIIPAMFMAVYPQLSSLNFMGLHSATSAILSAVIFNALVIVALIPLALRGVKYRPASAKALLRRNLLVYGLGGLIAPFIGIWAIDQVVRLIPGLA